MARGKFQKLSQEEKDKKHRYAGERHGNISE